MAILKSGTIVQGSISASSYTSSIENGIGFLGTASYAVSVLSASYAPTVLPNGIITSSEQVDYTQLQNIPSGIISSSTQVDYTQIQNIPSGSGTSATASYVEYENIANKPTLISSSQQITALTASLNTNQIAVTTATASISTIISSSVKRGIYSATEQIEPYIPSDVFSGVSIEYNAQRIGAIRSGIILASWSGSNISFTDVSNMDMGETYDLSFNFIKVGNDIILRANSLGIGLGDWTVQFLFKMFPNLL